MSEVLYRKYRPQTFGEVVGQEIVTTILKNAISSGKVAHAYLFTGPRGVGKTTAARLLAKAVNCLDLGSGEPCTKCQNCQLTQEGRLIDLIEIDAASYTGVDNIREIIDHVRFAPSIGRYKVFIIDEVHMLSKSAFNALLKTLEEPPAHAIFILATTEIQKVPATIISRSQRFDFRQISERDIQKVLEAILSDLKVKIEPEGRHLIARAAGGSLRDALSILDQLVSFGSRELSSGQIEEILGLTRLEVDQKFLELIVSGEGAGASKFVKQLVFEGKDIISFVRSFLDYLRLVLFVKMDVEKVTSLGLGEDEGKRLLDQAQNVSGARLLEIIKSFLECYRESKTSPIPELPILSHIFALTQRAEKREPSPKAENKIESRDSRPHSHLNLGTIVDGWAQVLSKIREYNHSLLSSLRLGRIVRLDGLELILAFPYNFHKETIEARKNRIVVEQVLEDVFREPLKVKILLERELGQSSTEKTGGGDLVSEAMKVLGGGESQ